jgi:hypothetical protein
VKAIGRQREMLERMLELESGARDIGAGSIGDGNDRVVGHGLSRLRGDLAVNRHGAALDRIARPRARLIEAARDERFIEP